MPEPNPANEDIKRPAADKEGLKRDLAERLKTTGKRVPALIEKELPPHSSEPEAAQTAIDAVRSAGGTPYYFSVNLTDAAAVANVISQVRERHGRIDVLLHAAGLERSHIFFPTRIHKNSTWSLALRRMAGSTS